MTTRTTTSKALPSTRQSRWLAPLRTPRLVSGEARAPARFRSAPGFRNREAPVSNCGPPTKMRSTILRSTRALKGRFPAGFSQQCRPDCYIKCNIMSIHGHVLLALNLAHQDPRNCTLSGLGRLSHLRLLPEPRPPHHHLLEDQSPDHAVADHRDDEDRAHPCHVGGRGHETRNT